jgi:hypothetical protein
MDSNAESALVCKGTQTDYSTIGSLSDAQEPYPVSMGIIVNFTNRTVQGFNSPGLDFPVKITFIDDVNISFAGSGTDRTALSATGTFGAR